MAEKQITGLGVKAAPLNRTTKGSERMALLAVNANFDGSGAGGDFVPTVVVVSDSGEVVGRFPANDTVAAGDSAEVTFAPFLRRERKSDPFSGGGLGSYFAVGESVPANSQSDFPWTFSSGDALLDVSAGHERLPVVLYAGVYIVVAAVRCDTATAGKQGFATLDMNSVGTPDGFASQFFPLDGVPTAPDQPFATVTVGKFCNVGDTFDVIMGHNNGVARTFSVFITVQRVAVP